MAIDLITIFKEVQQFLEYLAQPEENKDDDEQQMFSMPTD